MQQDLFQTTSTSSPLAHLLRPQRLEDYFGQEALFSTESPLRRWIQSDRIPSLILFGPPGCGKTTLAHLIASHTHARFESLSATHAGVKDIKAAADLARTYLPRKTILFVDEIHRFNKGQQDALLPHVEQGLFTLIGATSENPSFELNSALLSRCRVLRLEPLSTKALSEILLRAVNTPDSPIQGRLKSIDPDAIAWLAKFSDGDARRALTLLEAIVDSLSENQRVLDLATIQNSVRNTNEKWSPRYDADGDQHHQLISAFIKSIRASDPDAAIYYLARMIEGGEDPIFIARRLIVLASEDIGNAEPRALPLAVATLQAVQAIGLPEGRISLAQATTFFACAPKSRASYEAIESAITSVREEGTLAVPSHLQNPPKKSSTSTNLPTTLGDREFYQPADSGFEKQLLTWVKELRKNR